MAETVFANDSVTIGKTDRNGSSVRLSVLTLPAHLGWLRYLDTPDLATFLAELLEAAQRAHNSIGDWSAVGKVLESWEATAEVYASPELVRAVESGERELASGQGKSWGNLQNELSL